MKGWKRAAAAAGLALSVVGASQAAPPPGAPPAPSITQQATMAAKQMEAAMTTLKMTDAQKKRARKALADALPQIKKIDAGGGTDQQKMTKLRPVITKLQTEMNNILTPEQKQQAKAMGAQQRASRPGAPPAPPAPPR